jgi:hypothetical protein
MDRGCCSKVCKDVGAGDSADDDASDTAVGADVVVSAVLMLACAPVAAADAVGVKAEAGSRADAGAGAGEAVRRLTSDVVSSACSRYLCQESKERGRRERYQDVQFIRAVTLHSLTMWVMLWLTWVT